MKKIISIILIIISINSVGCSSKNISNNEINKMKETIEKVLFYEKSYDDEVSDYIDEKTFNECNYEVFYSYFIGKVKFTKYESEVKSILRAGNNHEKEYIVTVNKPINDEFVKKMSNGIRILGQVTKKCYVKKEGNNTFRIILTQGLNRQIRRMCESLGYEVVKLKRIRIMNINLSDLKIGKWRELTYNELKGLNELILTSGKTKDVDQ